MIGTTSSGSPGGLSEASWALLEASWGGELVLMVRLPSLGPSWGLRGDSFSLLQRLWVRLKALLGHLGALSGPPGSVVERFGSLSDGLGASERRKSENAKNFGKTKWKSTNLTSWGFRGRPLGAPSGPQGALLGHLRALLGFPESIHARLGTPAGGLGPSWGLFGTIFRFLWRLRARLEALLGHHGALSGPPETV